MVLHPPNDGVGIPLWLGPYMGFTEPEPPIIWNLKVPGDLPSGDYSLVFTHGSEPLSYAAPIHVAGQGRPPNSFEGWRAPPLGHRAPPVQRDDQDPDLELPETRSAISVFANPVEQFYRKYKTASPDDPRRTPIRGASELGIR